MGRTEPVWKEPTAGTVTRAPELMHLGLDVPKNSITADVLERDADTVVMTRRRLEPAERSHVVGR